MAMVLETVGRRGLLSGGLALAFSFWGAGRGESRASAFALNQIPQEFWKEFLSVSVDEKTSLVFKNRPNWISVGYQRSLARSALAERMLGNATIVAERVTQLQNTFRHMDENGRFEFDMIRGTRHYEHLRATSAAFFLIELYNLALAFQAYYPREGHTRRLLNLVHQTRPDYAVIRDTALQLAAMNIRAPNRVLTIARCLELGSQLLGDMEGHRTTADVISVAGGVQSKEGFFPELGAYDVGYHLVSMMQLCLLRCWWSPEEIERIAAKGYRWFAARVSADGVIDFSGSTRTTANRAAAPELISINYPEMAATCILLSHQYSDPRMMLAYEYVKKIESTESKRKP